MAGLLGGVGEYGERLAETKAVTTLARNRSGRSGARRKSKMTVSANMRVWANHWSWQKLRLGGELRRRLVEGERPSQGRVFSASAFAIHFYVQGGISCDTSCIQVLRPANMAWKQALVGLEVLQRWMVSVKSVKESLHDPRRAVQCRTDSVTASSSSS